MPKRLCPFNGDMQPQLKVHIGQKQVDNGVSNNKRMKDVYDKTLNLLKNGMKTFSDKMNETSEMDSIEQLSSDPPTCKLKSSSNLKKQMLLTDKLQLTTSDKTINGMQMDLCGCCRVIDQSTINRCSYCDQMLCSSCLSTCIGCLELFCQNCSLLIYNLEEQTMCLNCYR